MVSGPRSTLEAETKNGEVKSEKIYVLRSQLRPVEYDLCIQKPTTTVPI